MKEITDYGKVFETIVEKTAKYLTDNNIKVQILGISGGIDSTVCAAICHEVSKKTDIPLIGRSLPTKFNKKEETNSAVLTGKAFCDGFIEMPISDMYEKFGETLIKYEHSGTQTDLANGNIQARLRMIYLYNLASIHKGLVIDTDNLTENNLGYFTIHGDVGDFNPIGGLWKTEIFELAAWLVSEYYCKQYTFNNLEKDTEVLAKIQALTESLKLKPTAGLGITSNDLEELGAESYGQVDSILQDILEWKEYVLETSANYVNYISDCEINSIPKTIIENVAKRHFASDFKRKGLPLKIKRCELFR